MATPVVVQGTAVPAPQQTQNVAFGGGEALETEHTPSKTGCKDPFFAILFYLNVAAIFAVVAIYGRDSFSGDNSTQYTE